MNLEYKKIDRNREMEMTLLFLLTVEMIIVVINYYTMDIFNSNVNGWFFMSWALNLSATPLLAMVINGPNFALYRVGFRFTHLSTIVYIFYHSQQMIVPVFVIGFCFLELVYLAVGVSNGKMPFPGIVFSECLYRFQQQEVKSHQNMENVRGSDNMNFSIESDENNSSDEEELFDDPCYIPFKKDSSLKIC